MKTYREMANDVFTRRDEYLRKKTQQRRSALTAAAVLAAVVLTAGLIFAGRELFKTPKNVDAQNSTPLPMTTDPNAPPTSETPEAGSTPAVTDPAETPALTEVAAPTPGIETSTFESERSRYVSCANAVIAGGRADEAFTLDGGGVFFALTENEFAAYGAAVHSFGPGYEDYRLFDQLASWPRAVGEMAEQALAEKAGAETVDELGQLFGYYGDNYVVLTDAPFHDTQSSVILYTEDGENWLEMQPPEGQRSRVTGACVLPGGVAYVCYCDRSTAYYTPYVLTVYETRDGGGSWHDIGLAFPEEYADIVAPPCTALSPVMNGTHGVILVTYTVFDPGTQEFVTRTACFETFDGGGSWAFAPERSEI